MSIDGIGTVHENVWNTMPVRPHVLREGIVSPESLGINYSDDIISLIMLYGYQN
jgi:hypothetical protein